MTGIYPEQGSVEASVAEGFIKGLTHNRGGDYEKTEMPETPREMTVDPHSILNQVSEVDHMIQKCYKERTVLIGRYEEIMKGYHEHFNEVVNQPQPSIDSYPTESVMSEEAASYLSSKRRW